MPEQARELVRKDILSHLSALNEIIASLTSNNLDAAADIAETRMEWEGIVARVWDQVSLCRLKCET